jgi:hypothetical protein
MKGRMMLAIFVIVILFVLSGTIPLVMLAVFLQDEPVKERLRVARRLNSILRSVHGMRPAAANSNLGPYRQNER